jgi:hypothetical protein
VSNPSVIILAVPASSATAVAASQTPAGAGNLTINGSLATAGVATFTIPRRVSIASNGSDSAIVFVVYGTNGSGAAISSSVTGVSSSGAINTALDFLTVTQISVSGATAGAITAGSSSTASSPWVMDNWMSPTWMLSVAVSIASGSATYTVEHTYDDPNKMGTSLVPQPQQWSLEPASYVPPLAWPNATLVGQTTNREAQYANQPIFAHRLTITSGTGTVVMQSIQCGIGSP